LERREIELLKSGFHHIAPDFNTLTTGKVDTPCKEGEGGWLSDDSCSDHQWPDKG
jgi:hypothetical protein